jgi:hypothetical protein
MRNRLWLTWISLKASHVDNRGWTNQFARPTIDLESFLLYRSVFLVGCLFFAFSALFYQLYTCCGSFWGPICYVTSAFFGSLGASFVVLTTFECWKHIIAIFAWSSKNSDQLEGFWGTGTIAAIVKEPLRDKRRNEEDSNNEESRGGVIFLISDKIEELHPDWKGPIGPECRVFKAREWANSWDMDGAREIRDMFSLRNLVSPRVIVLPREQQPKTPQLEDHFLHSKMEGAPFAISLGIDSVFSTKFTHDLDFLRLLRYPHRTDSNPVNPNPGSNPWGDGLLLGLKRAELSDVALEVTPDKDLIKAAEKCNLLLIPFVGKKPDEPWADCAPHHLVPMKKKGLVAGGKSEDRPEPWEVGPWLKNPDQCNDFAFILRRTEIIGDRRRRVYFVVAGFTERGTAAASRFLREQWSTLYEAGAEKKPDRGDFFLIIYGPSNPNAKWKKVFGFWRRDFIKKGAGAKWPDFRIAPQQQTEERANSI